MNDTILRNWSGAIREAANAAIQELPADIVREPVHEAKLQILLRLDQLSMIGKLLQMAERIDAREAEEITEALMSELVEDAIVGITDERESMELLSFLRSSMEAIGKMPLFCALFTRALDGAPGASGHNLDDLARNSKARSDKSMEAFLAERRKNPGQ